MNIPGSPNRTPSPQPNITPATSSRPSSSTEAPKPIGMKAEHRDEHNAAMNAAGSSNEARVRAAFGTTVRKRRLSNSSHEDGEKRVCLEPEPSIDEASRREASQATALPDHVKRVNPFLAKHASIIGLENANLVGVKVDVLSDEPHPDPALKKAGDYLQQFLGNACLPGFNTLLVVDDKELDCHAATSLYDVAKVAISVRPISSTYDEKLGRYAAAKLHEAWAHGLPMLAVAALNAVNTDGEPIEQDSIDQEHKNLLTADFANVAKEFQNIIEEPLAKEIFWKEIRKDVAEQSLKIELSKQEEDEMLDAFEPTPSDFGGASPKSNSNWSE